MENATIILRRQQTADSRQLKPNLFKKIIIKWSYFATLLFISLFVFLSFPKEAKAADNGHYLIDYGLATNQTVTTGWNNIVDVSSAIDTTSYFPLVDSSGASSNATLHFTSGFNSSGCGGNNSGTTSSSLYPGSATQDNVLLSKLTWCGVYPSSMRM